ncbi:MAG: hypothetical protein WAT92_22980 [Saprospiraceae bacterium]
MNKIILFFAVFLLNTSVGISQDHPLTLVVNQNLVIPGQDLWFGIYQDEVLAKKGNGASVFPTVYMLIYDLEGKVISHQLYAEKKASFTGKLRISESLKPGTYVLSATIFDQQLSKIQIEESTTIHILGDENTVYHRFTKLGDCPLKTSNAQTDASLNDCFENMDKSVVAKDVPKGLQNGHMIEFTNEGPCGLAMERVNSISNPKGSIAINNIGQGNLASIHNDKSARNQICFDQIMDGSTPIICISKAENFAAISTMSYFTTESDWLYDFALLYFVPNQHKLPGFFHSGAKRIYQLRKAPQDLFYVLRIPGVYGDQKGQFLDVISSANINAEVEQRWLQPIWKCGIMQKANLDPKSMALIKSNISKSLIIQSIYKNEIALAEKKIYEVEGVNADDHIKLTVYQPFESVKLFFTEALPQIKVIKNKNKEDDIKMLNLDTRNPFPESPTLLVNGIIQEKSSDVFDIPYNEVDSISLYRQLKTTRYNFGALARNGVIDIHTKPGYKQKVSPIILSCLTEEQAFEKLQSNIEEANPEPFLSQLQFIGKPQTTPFCYQHNDEIGAFMVQIVTNAGVKNYYFGVASGMDE